MGERKGKKLPGFDYGNSPTEIQTIDFSGRIVIQITSAGTQGFANAKDADEVISGSLVNAEAKVSRTDSSESRIQALKDRVSTSMANMQSLFTFPFYL